MSDVWFYIGSDVGSLCFFLMIRRPPRSTQSRSSAASDVYKRQGHIHLADALVEDVAEIVYQHDHLALGLERQRHKGCLLYTSPSPRDRTRSRMPSSA